MTRTATDRWLYAWGLGSVAAGAASLLVPLYVVSLGGGPVALGVVASTAAAVGAPGAIVSLGLLSTLSDAVSIPAAVVVLVAVHAVGRALAGGIDSPRSDAA